MEKINFHELDKNGNHVIRLVGGDQEHRIALMAASEELYEALKNLVYRIDEGLTLGETLDVTPAREAIAKVKGD